MRVDSSSGEAMGFATGNVTLQIPIETVTEAVLGG
jgi:hypothetical protein